MRPHRFTVMVDPDLNQPTELTPRDYRTALSMLECAAKALEILYDRRDHLETAIEDMSMRAEATVGAAQAKTLEWQRLAANLRNEAEDLGRRLVAMQQRAEAAEQQLEAERARAEAAEHHAASALGFSYGLHSKIMSTFGQGSTAHKALLVAVDEVQPG